MVGVFYSFIVHANVNYDDVIEGPLVIYLTRGTSGTPIALVPINDGQP